MASPPAHLSVVESQPDMQRTFGRVLVGFDRGDRFDDTLALARRLVDPAAGRICVCDPLDGRHERISPAHADAVVVASAPHGPAGRICVDRRLLRVLRRTSVPVAVAPSGYRGTGPFHHIGVALDDSPQSAAALTHAYDLAARDGSAVTLLRALPRVADGLVNEHERLRERLAAQEQLARGADAAPAGVNPQARLLHGDPGVVIAQGFDGLVELVVCGSHGYGVLQRAVAGSVSKSLLEGATSPVLVVRADPNQKERST